MEIIYHLFTSIDLSSFCIALLEVFWQYISSSLERRLIRQRNLRLNPLLLNFFWKSTHIFFTAYPFLRTS